MYRLKLASLILLTGLVTHTSANAEDYVWLVAGAGGEQRYTEEFSNTLDALHTSLTTYHHYPKDQIEILGTPEEELTLEVLSSNWNELIDAVEPSDTFLLIMLGHGQSDFVEPKFNLKGPDLGGKTLASMMAALPILDKKVILSFPCSGHFSELLAPIEGMSVIASTDGPRQIYHSVINPFLVKAFEDEWSDQDGDGSLTFYELYQFLSNEVDDYYESHDFIQISNVSLEDNGDGRVTTFAPGMDAGDGDRARELRISPAPGYIEKPEIRRMSNHEESIATIEER